MAEAVNALVDSGNSYTVPADRTVVFAAHFVNATAGGVCPVSINGQQVAQMAATTDNLRTGPLVAKAGDVISTSGTAVFGISGLAATVVKSVANTQVSVSTPYTVPPGEIIEFAAHFVTAGAGGACPVVINGQQIAQMSATAKLTRVGPLIAKGGDVITTTSTAVFGISGMRYPS